MGRKSQIKPYLLIQDGDLSQSSIIGKESTVAQVDVVNLTFTWSGGQATNGDITVEVWSSNAIGWIALDFGATISLDGASGNHQLIIKEVSFEKLRPKYTRTNAGATGLLEVLIVATAVGA